MTTRQNLDRRFFLGLLLFIPIGLLAMCLQWVLGREIASDTFTVLAVATLCIGPVMFYRWRTPCANCRRPLGVLGILWKPGGAQIRSRSCPHCGVSIDDDCPDWV